MKGNRGIAEIISELSQDRSLAPSAGLVPACVSHGPSFFGP